MNRARPLAAAALFVVLSASCAPGAAPAPGPVPASPAVPSATAVPHAGEIRFALIGSVTPSNVWTLFDAKGYSYNNYAVRSPYWPRLYQLSIPERNFETMAASEMPSPFQQEGAFYTATVPLRSDLKWTDGTPFTAEDVAFTVNTALSFQLGFDWHDFYDPDFIDHAEALDGQTVKFYFKKQPNVGVWQYGALQGPIVQKQYWSARASVSAALLPASDLAAQIASLGAQAADLQSRINSVNSNIAKLSSTSSGYIQGLADLRGLQASLNQTDTALAKAQSQYLSAMAAARQSLYALDDQGEPTLGDWMPAGGQDGVWLNKVNPAHPFTRPAFDRAAYRIFQSENDALAALQRGEVDSILESGGLSSGAVGDLANGSISLVQNSTYIDYFLAFNLRNADLSKAVFLQALACLTDADEWAQEHPDAPIALAPRLLPSGDSLWSNPDAEIPCRGDDLAARANQIVPRLKSAGYSWDKETKLLPGEVLQPTAVPGWQGLKRPDGSPLPGLRLLAPDSGTDPVRAGIAASLADRLRFFGIPVELQLTDPEALNYAVFSSHQYDLAIVGWQVSEYPAYYCDWFKDGNPFGYHSDRLQSACEELSSTSDLSDARQDLYVIQSILAQDLPFVPLYSGIAHDAYRNIKYPFDRLLGGLSGIYGAPSLAIPAP